MAITVQHRSILLIDFDRKICSFDYTVVTFDTGVSLFELNEIKAGICTPPTSTVNAIKGINCRCQNSSSYNMIHW